MSKKCIILISGLPCSGKTTVAEIFRKYFNCNIVSMGDVIREESSKTGLEPHKIAIYLRCREGRRAVVNRVIDKVLKELENSNVVIVEGLRSFEELEAFREIGYNTVLIYVVASRRVRESRALSRGRAEDVKHVPSIHHRDLRESIYGLIELILYADYIINNDYEDLKKLEEDCLKIIKDIEKEIHG